MKELPLEGIRVADFTGVVAGPYTTLWLGVMGAEVIKIESNLRPDMMRTMVTPGKPRPAGLNQSVEFASLNYSKKSIALNMRQPKAVELVKKLVKLSDIVAENFGGPVMERWGLGYTELKKIKPDIIVYSGSGYGRTGPYKEFPAYAPVIDAFDGLLSMNGYFGGEAAMMGAIGWTDLVSGQHGAFAILTALYHRSKTGEGQYIDLSMTEQGIAFLPEPFMDYAMNARVRGRVGNRDDIMAPHGCYRCQGEDKWVAIAVSSEEEWIALCRAIGDPEWTKKEEFSDEMSRWKDQEELDRLITEWTINHDHREAMEILQKAGVMAGASIDMEDLANDPHLKERDFFVDMEHPEMGRLHLPGLPWRLNNSPEGNYEHPPLLGEHNDYVFGELLGLPRDEIKRLKEEKVIC